MKLTCKLDFDDAYLEDFLIGTLISANSDLFDKYIAANLDMEPKERRRRFAEAIAAQIIFRGAVETACAEAGRARGESLKGLFANIQFGE